MLFFGGKTRLQFWYSVAVRPPSVRPSVIPCFFVFFFFHFGSFFVLSSLRSLLRRASQESVKVPSDGVCGRSGRGGRKGKAFVTPKALFYGAVYVLCFSLVGSSLLVVVALACFWLFFCWSAFSSSIGVVSSVRLHTTKVKYAGVPAHISLREGGLLVFSKRLSFFLVSAQQQFYE